MRVRALLAAAVLGISAHYAPAAFARVIPVAQVTTEPEIPALQKLDARHVVVIEKVKSGYPGADRLVVYDARGVEAPRFLSPSGLLSYNGAAAVEGNDGALRILVFGYRSYVDASMELKFSADGGSTWSTVENSGVRTSGIGIGSPDVPFLYAASSGAYVSIRADGTKTRLATSAAIPRILGTDREGKRFLVTMTTPSKAEAIGILDPQGGAQPLFEMPLWYGTVELDGWITPAGAAYLNVAWAQGMVHPPSPFPDTYSVGCWDGGGLRVLASSSWYQRPVAAPTADFTGAWMAVHEAAATILKSHAPGTDPVERWRDPSAPWIASLHAGASGERVLVRTRRTRQVAGQPEAWGVALWAVGSPRPPAYDDLLLSAFAAPAAFAHLDVDAAAQGAPFWIDTGSNEPTACPGWCQEVPKPLGLVRASLKQRLVIPASARIGGAAGATWRTDLLVRNPEAQPVVVTARVLPNPSTGGRPADATLSIPGGAVAVLPDVLATLFHLESGSGAILLLPEGNRGVRATSRTYTRSPNGTYGMSVDAVDAQSASAIGFPTIFAGALPGTGFRTNVVAADAEGAGAALSVSLSNGAGRPSTLAVPPGGQSQLNGLAAASGVDPSATAGARLVATTGSVVPGLIAIDDATNDPSWFGPSPRPDQMWIPAIVHADGAGGAKFRTDLYVDNPEPISRSIWIGNENIELAAGESRVVPDVLFNTLGRTGAEPLFTFQLGVRVTSRTYTQEADGSTYGTVIPPLDALELAAPGETLEILGPVGGAGFRTNLRLLALLDDSASAHVEVLDESGATRSAFDTPVPGRSTVQLDDLLRARGLGDGPEAGVIRVNFTKTAGPGAGGTFAAYATTIDNGTNDPVYFAGALGSH